MSTSNGRITRTGWGQTKLGSKMVNVLRQAELPVVHNKHCTQMYSTMYSIAIKEYHLCAGPLHDGGVGTCIVSRAPIALLETKLN